MKKILLSVALLATTFASATAQVEYKPQAGHATADFSLFANGIFNQTASPIKLGDREGINAGLLKGRYFVNENLALRASLGLASGSSTTKDSNLNTENVKKSNEFTLGFGAEHHFSGTDRLSPYIGAEVFLGSVTSSHKDVSSSRTITTKSPSGFLIGGDLLLGADYYIARHLYLGAEAGLELRHTSTGKGNVTTAPKNGSTTSVDGTQTENAGGINTGLRAGFKIGFVF